MTRLSSATPVAILGAGTMGAGIAQVAATYGHPVAVFDIRAEAREQARANLARIMNRLVEKGRVDQDTAHAIQARIRYIDNLQDCRDSGLVIEAIVENLAVKQEVFRELEDTLDENAILASNTSSLSIAAIGASCKRPERVLGAHFFNPAPLMKLVEVIPGLATDPACIRAARTLFDAWGKVTVLAKDTPGFIVNRVARPFYGEAIRLLEEGAADSVTIDHAMKEIGGFRMGPFQLMDFIGNDINLKVTQTVYEAFFYDPRYRPSFTQQRLVEAGRLGRKSGHGYYDYREGAVQPVPSGDREQYERLFNRILAMLINEAVDAVFWQVASPEDIDLAMQNGANYPKGLLAWSDEIGLDIVLNRLTELQEEYGEDRYRPSPLMKRMVRDGRKFFG